jgi:hypothetical protein
LVHLSKKAAHAVSRGAKEAKHAAHTAAHWSHNAIHKVNGILTTLDDSILKVRDFMHAVPVFDKVLDAEIPGTDISLDDFITRSHEVLENTHMQFRLLEAGIGTIDRVLDEDKPLKDRVDKFCHEMDQSEGKINGIIEEYNKNGDKQQYKNKISKYLKYAKQAKGIAKVIMSLTQGVNGGSGGL